MDTPPGAGRASIVAAGPRRMRFRAALTELAQLDKSDLESALRRILTTDADVLEVSRVSFWELVPDHSAISCRVLYQRDAAAFHEGDELRACDFPAYFEAMLECRAIVAHDAWTDPRTSAFLEPYFRPHDIRSMLDVPVWRRGKLAGVVCHEMVGRGHTWATEEQDFALGVGNMVSVALEAVDRRRAEERNALVARATNDALWDWDVQRNSVDWNDALYSVFRYRPEDVVPTCDWWMKRLHPEDRARIRVSLATTFESGRTTWSEQYRWARGDGSIATVMDRGLIVRDERGVAVRMLGSMVDISERVAMQARLALSDRMASIGTLAAGVAHEINNPLTYIKANLTCAIDDLRTGADNPGTTEGILELLREAQEGAERVRRIVRDLQIFSRPKEDEVEDLDVGAVIESSINMAWNEIRHRAQLVKEYGPMPPVRMNRARLGQVILNLLINSAQAIPEGNVHSNRIDIATRAGTGGGEVIVEIRDTGCGIPPDVIGHIFEPFFTTKPVGVGTGLGLSICHSIVTAAGGRIELESPARGGCLVRVVLPAAIATAPVQPRDGAAQAAGARRRVLLVDDEPPVRRALRRMLEPTHEVVTAESGEKALEQLLAGAEYDVILCDVMMPRMTGTQLYERLVIDHAAHARRMIFMTGGAFSRNTSEFLAGCDRPVLDKPIDRAALGRALAALDG